MKTNPEQIRLYRVMNVDECYLRKEQSRYILETRKVVFKTRYISHIPVLISDSDFEKLKSENKTYKGAKASPLIHDIRKQAIKYLKDTNRFNN